MSLGRRDIRAELAAAPLLADLRAELLVAPDETVARAHLETMGLERHFVARPAGATRRVMRVRRSGLPRGRRVACAVAALGLAFTSFGLDVAGATSKPFKPITDTLTHLGNALPPVLPDMTPPPLAGAHAVAPVGARAAAGDRVLAPTRVAAPVVSAPPAPPISHEPLAPRGSGPPPKHDRPSKGGPPPGLPRDWQARTIAQARAALSACARSDAPAPSNCPQLLDAAAPPDAVQWTLLSQPLADAIATVEVPLSDAGPHGTGTEVNVYGRFQIVGSYTVAGSATRYLTYIGGVAQATMTWDGKRFPNVTFAAGAIDPPPGVNVPTFDQPDAVDDAAVLDAAQAGFAQWRPDAELLAGATVSFDAQHGDFTVSGSFTTTGDAPETGTFSATLVYDGAGLVLIGISAT